MAEEKPIVPTDAASDGIMSHDDVSMLNYVLHHVKGSSPSSITLLQLQDLDEE